MKKKNLILLGITAFSTLALAACSPNNSESGKKAFISDLVTLNDSNAYNSKNVKLSINEFKLYGEGSSEFNSFFSKGAELNFNIGLDEATQLVSLEGKGKFEGKNYNLRFLMSQKGIYIDNTDIKSLYNSKKTMIPSSASDVSTVYGAMIDSLDKKYLMVDSETIDSGVQSSDESWSSTVKELFKTSKKVKKSDLEKTFKKIPNSDFTKKGEKVTLKVSGKEINLKELINTLSSTSSITKKQVEKFIKESEDVDISKLSLKITTDSKTRKMTMNLSGTITDTKESSSLDLNISLDSEQGKLKASIKEPTSTETNTLEEIQNSAISKLMLQSDAT